MKEFLPKLLTCIYYKLGKQPYKPYEARVLKFHWPYSGIQRGRERDRTKIVCERAAVSGGHKSVRLREQLLDGMQNAYKAQQKKSCPCLTFQTNADNHSILKGRTLKSAVVILRYLMYLTNLYKHSINLYKDLAPTQVKCS